MKTKIILLLVLLLTGLGDWSEHYFTCAAPVGPSKDAFPASFLVGTGHMEHPFLRPCRFFPPLPQEKRRLPKPGACLV